MANVIIVLILVAAVGYGIYSFIHHLRHGGGCCGEHDAPAKKVRAADTKAIRDAGYLPLRTKEKV